MVKLPGTVANFLPFPVDGVDALQGLEPLAPAAVEEEVWPQGAHDGSGWWWSPEQAASYPAQWAVVDTSQLLDHLEAVRCIVAQMTGMNCIVPRVVLKELELLERLEDSSGTCQAQAALRFVRSQLLAFGGFRCACAGDRSALVLQGEAEMVYEGLLGKSDGMPLPSDTDAHILACVRYFAEQVAPDMTELLTSSRSLSIKVAFHGVPSENIMMLMGRGVVSSASVGRPVADADPPGLGMSALMVMAAEHAAESYAKVVDSDDGNEDEKIRRGKAYEFSAPGLQDPPGLSQDESATGGPYLRSALRNPPGLKATKAGDPAKHGCAPSTRSPSSEDGCGEFSTEVSSSPDGGFSLESPLGPVPLVSPPWRRLPDVDCDEEDEEVDADEEVNKSSDRPSRRVAGGERSGGERDRKARAAMDATSVVLRGLPFNVTEEEVLAFIRKAGVSREDLAPEGVVALLANAQGRPSGFAEVRLARGVDFCDVRVRLHMQHLRGRYIEALPPRPARKSAAKNGGGRLAGRKA